MVTPASVVRADVTDLAANILVGWRGAFSVRPPKYCKSTVLGRTSALHRHHGTRRRRSVMNTILIVTIVGLFGAGAQAQTLAKPAGSAAGLGKSGLASNEDM